MILNIVFVLFSQTSFIDPSKNLILVKTTLILVRLSYDNVTIL